jgi:23S rRNA (cytosine1962-C5)-methyltransferase/23S rRNA (guanine2445-N2)-methyltransferase / 23S rRNA (guanine2069-N7)-methyltransferase
MKTSSPIVNRLKKNLKARKSIINKNKLTAYRLYEKDIPEYPYIIDIYNEFALIYEKGKKINYQNEHESQIRMQHQEDIILALQEVMHIEKKNIIFKERKRQKGKEQYKKLQKKSDNIVISENSIKYYINLYDYLDTGLFLDHRPLRQIIKEKAKNKNILNLFAYTGSLSVAAAIGGAKSVTTIDMSKTYLDWAQDNFQLNSLSSSNYHFIQADILNYINQLSHKFDIIILDPPSFSNSKRMEKSFNVQDDHPILIQKLMNHLGPNGILYFSNNFRKFKLDPKIIEDYQVQDMSLATIPKDFRDLKIHYCYKITHK